ncbi:hypothetical protein LINGRAHAP2_LOCUS31202 [Linum grandiflorum]
MRCSAHVLNPIVKVGLDVIKDGIKKIGNLLCTGHLYQRDLKSLLALYNYLCLLRIGLFWTVQRDETLFLLCLSLPSNTRMYSI